jgi:hypothetical protein
MKSFFKREKILASKDKKRAVEMTALFSYELRLEAVGQVGCNDPGILG